MKVIITESQYNRAIDYYISHVLEPDEVKPHKKHPDSIVWTKDGEFIAQTQESKYFWVRSDIWKDISRMFNFNYDETQSAIKIWLEQHSNLGELRPRSVF